jgi:ATP-dependent DNA helicase RecG
MTHGSHNDFLTTSIEFLKGVGPMRAELIRKELGLATFEDLLNYYPFRYVDRSQVFNITDLDEDLPYIQLRGVLGDFEEIGKGKAARLTASFTDATGSIELVWFQGQKWVKEACKPGQEYIVFGKPSSFKSMYSIVHPELEDIKKGPSHLGLQPIYSVTEKLKARNITSKVIQQAVFNLIHHPNFGIDENLPLSIINNAKLTSRLFALKHIHLPGSNKERLQAERRLKFEELFILQMRIVRLKLKNKTTLKGIPFTQVGKHFLDFYQNHLSFELTNAQKRVIKEIRADLYTGQQMNRLLQGDVGSGKSIVALLLMILAADNGTQSSLMAPTEILAFQHYESMHESIEAIGLKAALLTGSTKTAARKKILAALELGEIDILIGTHALIEDRVKMKRQGLVIIDEQHRFGVAQRAKMWDKSQEVPHILVMTATPIPRTLAMTVYGDLDVSIIDEMPVGRKPIKTIHKNEASRMEVFDFIKHEVDNGRQIYVVYPLIEDSEKLEYKNLMDGFELIQTFFPRPKYFAEIIHGKMKPAEKDFVMNRFKKGEIQILISTTVIEVGINVPNATVMVIENAESFGLSQLHQLRGRVGRGSEQSYCLLMSGNKLTKNGRERIKAMLSTTDGFKLAELDLKLRGPGDIEGTQQSGLMELKIASLVDDEPILKAARFYAESILTADPGLRLPENEKLKQYLVKRSPKTDWSLIS